MSTSSTPGGPGRRGAAAAVVAGLAVGAIAAGGAYAYGNGSDAAKNTPAASSATRVQVAHEVAALERPQIDATLAAVPPAAVPAPTRRTKVVRRARVVVVTHRVQVAATGGATAANGIAAAGGEDGLVAGAQPVTKKHEIEGQGDDAGAKETEHEDAQGATGTKHHGDGGDGGNGTGAGGQDGGSHDGAGSGGDD